MRRRLLTTGLYGILTLASFAVGFGTAQRASATTYTLELRIMGGASSYVTCGWHGECDDTPTSGVSIDWGNYSNHQIYFRVFAYRNSGSEATLGRGTVERADGSTCKTVWVNVSSLAGVVYRGSVGYVHSETNADGNPIDIVFNTTAKWTESNFGTTATDENQTCKDLGYWSAEHLHEYVTWDGNSVTGQYRNTGVYLAYVNPDWYYIDVSSYWTDRATWTVTQ